MYKEVAKLTALLGSACIPDGVALVSDFMGLLECMMLSVFDFHFATRFISW